MTAGVARDLRSAALVLPRRAVSEVPMKANSNICHAQMEADARRDAALVPECAKDCEAICTLKELAPWFLCN